MSNQLRTVHSLAGQTRIEGILSAGFHGRHLIIDERLQLGPDGLTFRGSALAVKRALSAAFSGVESSLMTDIRIGSGTKP